jgi:hypothetical protein
MSTNQIKNIRSIIMTKFVENYPILKQRLDTFKENLKEIPTDKRKEFVATLDKCVMDTITDSEPVIKAHSETVHPEMPIDWKENAKELYTKVVGSGAGEETVVMYESNDPNIKYELNILEITDAELYSKLLTDEIQYFPTYSSTAKMFFENFGISKSAVLDKVTMTPYVVVKTNNKTGKLVTYPYYQRDYVEPSDDYRLLGRKSTVEYCGWTSPYGTEENFNTMYKKMLEKPVVKLVVRILK